MPPTHSCQKKERCCASKHVRVAGVKLRCVLDLPSTEQDFKGDDGLGRWGVLVGQKPSIKRALRGRRGRCDYGGFWVERLVKFMNQTLHFDFGGELRVNDADVAVGHFAGNEPALVAPEVADQPELVVVAGVVAVAPG